MKKHALTIFIALCSIGAMAQIDTSKVSEQSTTHLALDSIHPPSAFINTGAWAGTSGFNMPNVNWDVINMRTLIVQYAHREKWSVGPIDDAGNAKVHIKRSMVHWINDSTAYISTRIRKPKKHASAYYKKHAY